MPKRTPITGEKNLIGKRLIELRRQRHMSQRLLAYKLQLRGSEPACSYIAFSNAVDYPQVEYLP